MLTENTSANEHQLSWPVITHIRIALHELRYCQDLALQDNDICMASLIDAYDRIGLAIHKEKERIRSDTAKTG
jgi:hypothetical protein